LPILSLRPEGAAAVPKGRLASTLDSGGHLGPDEHAEDYRSTGGAGHDRGLPQEEENSGKNWTASPQFTEAAKPEIAEQIRKNGELMGMFGISGTPGIAWKDKHGKMQIKSGMPRLSEIPQITGLPEQKVEDPALARFR
jgi:thiol:disulfide interchange protein DsbG